MALPRRRPVTGRHQAPTGRAYERACASTIVHTRVMDIDDENDPLARYQRALLPRFTPATSEEDRALLLQSVVLDLLLEVHALRMTIADASPELRTRYADHYRRIALLSHNTAGAIMSSEKLVRAFLDAGLGHQELVALGGDREERLREETMLQRLGVDVERYRHDVTLVEQLT
jgi:hypothetical protein